MNSRDLNRRVFLTGTTAAVLAVGLDSGVASAAERRTSRSADDIVTTESGQVTGTQGGLKGIVAYKGIPYAAATAGDNRWRPPQPAPSWDDVRRANSWGPACPQPVTGIPSDQVPELSEDCLNLNIWTGAATSGESRPVLVWLPGGWDSAVWAGQEIYNGALLANKGVVFVSVNHRVGPFAGLAHPDLSAESGHSASGNWGALDVVAALEWVSRNIAAFGGDPDRVTLGGWQNGANLVDILMASQSARGLFHRALLPSGTRYTRDPALGQRPYSYRTLAAAEANGTSFAAYLGASSLADLRGVSADEIVAKTYADDAPGDATDFGDVLDGYVLPSTYTEAMESGAELDVPVLTGNCRDGNSGSPTLAEYQAYAESRFGPAGLTDTFLGLYPATTDTEAATQYNNYARDEERVSTFLWGGQFEDTAGSRSSVHTYFWTRVPPGHDATNPVVGTGTSGAFDGADVYYLLGFLYNTDRPWASRDYDIADTAASYVANFVATGNPNGGSLTTWPVLDTGTPQTMELGDHFATLPAADSDAKYAFLKAYLTSQPISY
ncbi:carboxylesterase/lipase family protein [Streptomyces xylophagus]|uniref:carboxylesterase/lipase family protein n=1 Tax=Streptomyces xylophagus TaxID=285514 RepID=UPI0005BD3C51|nr:carboxylesterase family protein [Streptomyces xylophagus]